MQPAKREDILGVRLTEAERARIKAQAAREGRTDSALVRHVMLSYVLTAELGVVPSTVKESRSPANTSL